jgi:hypothetical protein
MANSYETYPGDGVQTDWAVPFDYLDQSHVQVLVDGVVTTYTWVNASTVRVSPAVASGHVVKVMRVTPIAPLTNFENTNNLNADNLNIAEKQSLFVAVEASDATADTVRKNSSGQWEADNLRINDVANPVSSQDAATKSYVDTQDAATIAAGNASAAAAATSATAAASSATSAASSATAASTAKTGAETAEAGAQAAQAAAETARDDAAASAASLDASNIVYKTDEASQAEAETGTDNTKWTSPLRVAQSFAKRAHRTLVATMTASNSTILTAPSVFTSAYDLYEIEFEDLYPAVNQQPFLAQFTRDAGASWIATNYFNWMYSAGGAYDNATLGGTSFFFGYMAGTNIPNNAALGYSAKLQFTNPNSVGKAKRLWGIADGALGVSLTPAAELITHALHDFASTLTGFRIFAASGNIAAGKVRIYGVKTS